METYTIGFNTGFLEKNFLKIQSSKVDYTFYLKILCHFYLSIKN